MNRKQLTLILVLGVLIGGLGLFLYKKDNTSWKDAGSGAGGKVLGDFPVNDVATLVIKQPTNSVTIARKDDTWVVKERHDYPANFSEVGDFLIKMRELKAVQTEQIGASQLSRLELIEPGKGDKAGTLVEFKDANGKALRSLLLGKKHMKKSAAPSPMGDDGGWPDGRYVMSLPGNGEVALISDALSSIEAKPEQWILKDFFKVEKVKSVAVVQTNAVQNWKLSRETETGEMKLADPKEGETLDTIKAGGLSSVLSYPSFVDIVAPSTKPEDIGIHQPVVASIETFDQFTYTISVGGKSGEDNYHMKMAVAAAFPKERTPGQDEKAEDKDKLDKEFKEKTSKFEEKLKTEKKFEPWTYTVSKWTVESLIKERKDLMQEKKEDKKEDAPSAVDVPGLSPSSVPPGVTLPPLPQ